MFRNSSDIRKKTTSKPDKSDPLGYLLSYKYQYTQYHGS
jgi:hypothetical protein